MLKTLGSTESTTRPEIGGVGVGDDSINGGGGRSGNFDMTTRSRSKQCLPAKTVDFDYTSEADH